MTREADNPKGDDLSRIRRNAKRLLRDAVLLNDNGRHASAFALAVLGLEEIGKVILRLWRLPNYSYGQGTARYQGQRSLPGAAEEHC